MNTILDYLTINILTMYENNIKQHYVEYVEKYVNISFNKREEIEKIKKKYKSFIDQQKHISYFCNQLRKIKFDLLNIDDVNFTSDSKYHNWINENIDCVVPIKNKFTKKSIYYDVKCNSQDYLPCMIYMMQEIENNGYSINNVFPTRTSIVPKHIRIDTTTLVYLLMDENKAYYSQNGNLKKYENDIWEFFFETNKKCFRKSYYSFHHMIETDGISCSILLKRNDLVGKTIRQKTNNSREEYIDELKNYTELQDKNIVAIDPNMSDLLYCVDSDRQNRNFFRYTQNQRRKELKIKKYRDIILNRKNKNSRVIELETELSKYNRKTLNIREYKKYIKKKNKVNEELFEFYEEKLFRKLNLNGYWNRLRSEQRLINNFKRIFGEPEDTIVCIGDFEQKKHMKFKEPVKGKGFRSLFRKHKYKVYLVDEFRTSQKCSRCRSYTKGICEPFKKIDNPRPYLENKITCYGLLKCKTCGGLWNRDENSSRNIYKIAKYAIAGRERPAYLRRPTQ